MDRRFTQAFDSMLLRKEVIEAQRDDLYTLWDEGWEYGHQDASDSTEEVRVNAWDDGFAEGLREGKRMPVEAKTEWDRLKAQCLEVGLPVPVITPGLFASSPLSIEIRHEGAAFGFQHGADNLDDLIGDTIIYVWGYRNCMRDSVNNFTPTGEGDPR